MDESTKQERSRITIERDGITFHGRLGIIAEKIHELMPLLIAATFTLAIVMGRFEISILMICLYIALRIDELINK